MDYFRSFSNEIKINVFKYVDHPLNLALTCKDWATISKDPSARTEWLIISYGKTCALSCAVRLGPTFINMEVFQTLVSRNVTFSRYFVLRILRYIRECNEISKQSWANELSLLIYLLNEGYNRLAETNEYLEDINNLILDERLIPLSLKPIGFQRTSQNRRRRNKFIRKYRKCIQYSLHINNKERLEQITSIPLQTTVNDPKIFEFYNGFSLT
ncbi:hypothetical protein RclHR1_05400006 [Rhizophagus clarus]|uniref:F-box domain-containing protein n=1 Tax=Rhizophagus clarus TaxID=94130 RepID=A0A2Z6RNB3_9GLOM|nr:hypothetical protein RclHR1_05400006 [Rhizophagus clarus]GES98185.1 hypothetical protein GLOIN_2v1490054 [Rhizophagus clarus]